VTYVQDKYNFIIVGESTMRCLLVSRLSEVFNWKRERGGGSSLINSQMYTKGNCKDYDKWAEMGNEGWNCVSVTKHVLKHERMNITQLCTDMEYHSPTGDGHFISSLLYRTCDRFH
ncbi:hypothetical protein ANN_21306, partial [Periplaneta americana]